jgi:hypothetical protein
MGQEIGQEAFDPADFETFAARLADETARLRSWFAHDRFSRRGWTAGFEMEAWLVGDDARPRAMNQEFLECLGNDLVVPELSRFNVELNGSHTSCNR